MTLSVVSRLNALCVVGAALTVSANAGAHYYGILINKNVQSGNADQGNAIYINTDIIVSNTCSDFVTHEMWYGTVAGAQYWVEVGFIAGGAVTNGHCVGNSIFWADFRPNGGGFNVHYPSNGWFFDSWYQLEIVEGNANSCQWGVYVGSTNLIGTSTNNCPGTGRYVAAGIETTTIQNTSINAKGWVADWQELGAQGWTNYGNWDGASRYEDSPPFEQDTSGSAGFPEKEEVLNASL